MMDPGYLCKEILQLLHENELQRVTLSMALSDRFPITPQCVLAKQSTVRKMIDGKNLVKNIGKFSYENTNYVHDHPELLSPLYYNHLEGGGADSPYTDIGSQITNNNPFAPHGMQPHPSETPIAPNTKGISVSTLNTTNMMNVHRSPSKVIGEIDQVTGKVPQTASITVDLASIRSLPELRCLQGRITFYGMQFDINHLIEANGELRDAIVHEVQASSTYSSTNNVFQALMGFGPSATTPPRLRVVITPSSGRGRCANHDEAQGITHYGAQLPSFLQIHSKDALYPPEMGVDTIHIVVVRTHEAEEYIHNYCNRGYVVAVIPEHEEDESVGCIRYWSTIIARILKVHWLVMLDDNFAAHEQVRASNAPSNPKHVAGGPKKYVLPLMTGIKLLEDIVLTLRGNASKVGLLSLRRAGSSTGNGKAISLAVCKGFLYMNIDQLFLKSIYYRKEMFVYEDLYLSQCCLLNKLACLQLSYVEHKTVNTVGPGLASIVNPNELYEEQMMMHQQDQELSPSKSVTSSSYNDSPLQASHLTSFDHEHDATM